MKLSLAVLLTIAIFVFPSSARSGVPLDTVRERVHEVLDVLRDPALREDAARQMKRDRIRTISTSLFDFGELSRRTLGRNWTKLSPAQQEEFTALYRDILEAAYMDRILAYSDEKVEFRKEVMLSATRAEVQSTVITRTNEIPIHYRLLLMNDSWRVYDVIIEGVSLVKNYRTQFREILASKSTDQLLEILRKKAEK